MATELRCLIVDDDDLDRLAIESMVSDYSFLRKVAVCASALEAFEFVNQFHPDIIFADIEMPGLNGVELIRKLSGSVPAPVFVTSHPEFAVEGYELEAFDYILKPLTSERFARCVQRLKEFFELRDKAFAFDRDTASNVIIIKQGRDKHKISLEHILYLEAMKDYTKIVTTTSQYLVLGTISGMQEQLPATNFMRIHRSFIVNVKKISAAKVNKLIVSTHELPIGKLYRKDVEKNVLN